MPALLVNGEEIAETAIQRETAAMLALMSEQMTGEDPVALRIRAREWAEENLIEAELLRQAALDDPETRLPEAQDSPESEAQLRTQRLVGKVTGQVPPPRREEIDEFYASHRESFQEPERLRVAHIVRNVDEVHTAEAAHAAIEEARAALAGGRPFAEVADAMSDCPGRGGELDLFSRGEMVPAFEDAVFRLDVNEVSGIFRTEFGFHIAKLLERRPAAFQPLEQVRPQIASQLLHERQQQQLYRYLDELRARSRIQGRAEPVA